MVPEHERSERRGRRGYGRRRNPHAHRLRRGRHRVARAVLRGTSIHALDVRPRSEPRRAKEVRSLHVDASIDLRSWRLLALPWPDHCNGPLLEPVAPPSPVRENSAAVTFITPQSVLTFGNRKSAQNTRRARKLTVTPRLPRNQSAPPTYHSLSRALVCPRTSSSGLHLRARATAARSQKWTLLRDTLSDQSTRRGIPGKSRKQSSKPRNTVEAARRWK